MRRTTDIAVGHDVDELMRYAVSLLAFTHPHPNPRVAALIVSPDGVLMSSGVHTAPGQPHAETQALAALASPGDATGSTVIVTLEPCSHHGRTPPCADALIEAGVSTVIIGTADPDPRVSGAGIERLRSAGIDVGVGVLEHEVVAADPHYFHQRRTGRPFVTLKLAATLDGQVAAADGTSRWITGSEARSDAHALRSTHDAVLVGAGTVIADDPSLTVRTPGYDGPQPVPVVLVGDRVLPGESRIAERDPVLLGLGTPGFVDVGAALDELADRGFLGVLVEGGPTVARAFLDADAVDHIVWYIGASLGGGVGRPAIGGTFETIADRRALRIDAVTHLGGDLRIDAYPSDPDMGTD